MRVNKRIRHLRHQLARERYEMRRRSISYRKKRRKRLLRRRASIVYDREVRREQSKKQFLNKSCPSNFSFIDNTEEVLSYLNECRDLLHKNEKVKFDIANVENISSDAIALLVACTNSDDYKGKYGKIQGNGPRSPHLAKLFRESGFYNFVNSSKELKSAKKGNLLHKESHYRVRADIAKEACLYGIRNVFGNEVPVPSLYEMLVEAMSNTNNHASKSSKDRIKWWLYTYYNKNDNITSYTFIDLGVGIFESIPVQRYKKVIRSIGLIHNADLVYDLLNGKIKSSQSVDNAMRGKGIPQIAANSQESIFRRAFIISNNVKIDLKDQSTIKLNSTFNGTLLYWELSKTA